MIHTLLFDLDGTLTDSKPGIITSVMFALKQLGIGVDDLESLTAYVGPPLKEGFMMNHFLSEADALKAVDAYRTYYNLKGKFDNKPYEGVRETLTTLKESGYRLAIATSKPTVLAEEILKHFQLAHFFDLIMGSNLDQTRTAKTEVIQAVIDAWRIEDPSNCLMIGDRRHDVEGAHDHKIETVGCLYGYGGHEELTKAGATHLIKNPLALIPYLKLRRCQNP